MADKPNLLNYAPAGPRFRRRLAGRVRWIGLVAFVVGLWIYIDWGVTNSTDYLIRRWGLGGAILGALVYLEGLAASIREESTSSPPLPADEDAG